MKAQLQDGTILEGSPEELRAFYALNTTAATPQPKAAPATPAASPAEPERGAPVRPRTRISEARRKPRALLENRFRRARRDSLAPSRRNLNHERNRHPPRARLSNTECLAILTSSYLVAKLDDLQKRALFRAIHALARRVAYKERAARNKADKVAPPVTETSAPAPDAAETPTTNE